MKFLFHNPLGMAILVSDIKTYQPVAHIDKRCCVLGKPAMLIWQDGIPNPNYTEQEIWDEYYNTHKRIWQHENPNQVWSYFEARC
jgi:hypothetical protein